MRDDRSNTEADAGEFERHYSTEYTFDPDPADAAGMDEPARPFDLDRFLAEDEAIRQSDWYKKNITSAP